jgi:hypothetical protein
MFENLTHLVITNPIILGIIVGLTRNILGYIENKIKNTEEKYQISELGKTIAKYLFLLITTGQALGPEQAMVASVALEYLSTAIKGTF